MTNLSETAKESKEKLISGGAWNLFLDTVQPWAFVENVFTPEECQKIIEIGNGLEQHVGDVFAKEKTIRKSFVSWIFPSKDNRWIFERLTSVVLEVNKQCFGFNIHSFSEGLQFTRYHEPDGFYGVHIDRGINYTIRKLSLSIQLNDSSEFDGGDLLFYLSPQSMKAEMKQGTMAAFPSYVLHEVTPVTRGTRYSLVAWISGPPFR